MRAAEAGRALRKTIRKSSQAPRTCHGSDKIYCNSFPSKGINSFPSKGITQWVLVQGYGQATMAQLCQYQVAFTQTDKGTFAFTFMCKRISQKQERKKEVLTHHSSPKNKQSIKYE